MTLTLPGTPTVQCDTCSEEYDPVCCVDGEPCPKVNCPGVLAGAA